MSENFGLSGNTPDNGPDNNPHNNSGNPADDPMHLLGAYALDAVDPGERAVVEEYLRHHPEAFKEVQSYLEVAAWLGYSTSIAPAGLWDQIQEALDESAPSPGPELAKVLSLPSPHIATPPVSVTDSRRPPLRWWLVSAAAVLVAVAVSAVVVTPRSTADPLQIAVEQLQKDRDARIAVLTHPDSEAQVQAFIDLKGHGYLLAENLPRLDRNLTYQLWGVIGDQVISLGVLGPSPSIETFTARADLSVLAITIEPAGGVISDGNPEGAFVGEVT
jgi:anti-sigma factor RsiW